MIPFNFSITSNLILSFIIIRRIFNQSQITILIKSINAPVLKYVQLCIINQNNFRVNVGGQNFTIHFIITFQTDIFLSGFNIYYNLNTYYMKPNSGELFYCVKCKEKRKAVDARPFVTANKRHALRGKCAVCSTTVVKCKRLRGEE